MTRNILTALLLLTHIFTATAAVKITGTVIDKDHEPLSEAGIRLLAAPDSSYVKGVAADIDGKFTLNGVPKGKYILECTYVGFKTSFTPLSVASNPVNLGNIILTESSVLLSEATVTGVKTPIKVMEDTIEFNADSYKTQPNAVVEDLLKRLPGVEVGSDGKITANGKDVTKILIDGKEFFSDDPKVASKNLPVNMVEKLQVVDRKSDLARLTGVDDGEEETVINLTVKKGMKNGWFGTAEAGYGTDRRYQEAFNINRFWADNQLTVLGGANNTNDPGFTDGNGNRFRRFGGQQGINTSQTLGLNFNVGNAEIFRIGGDVMYSHTDQDTRKRRERLLNLPSRLQSESSASAARDKGHNIRADFRVEWKPDSFNTVDFRPNFSYNTNNSLAADTTTVKGGTDTYADLSKTINGDNSNGHSFEFGGRLIYNHNFASHRGRSFSIHADYRLSNVREKENSLSWIRLFNLIDNDDDNNDDQRAITLTDQWLDNHTWSNSMQARASWTEPIGNARNGNFITASYRLQYRWNNADKNVYDRLIDYSDPFYPSVVQDVLQFNPDLSNRFRNTFFTQNLQIGYKKVSKKLNFEGGLSAVPQTSRSTDLINDARSIDPRHVWNFAPYMRLRLKFSPQRSITTFYRGRSSQPSMAQLQPVEDLSNPMKIVVGNPDLDPTFSHNLMFRFQDFNPEAQRSIMLMANAQLQQNSIVQLTTYNAETGAQRTTYTNVNGVWNARVGNMISLPLRNRAFSFSSMTFVNLVRNVGFNNANRNASLMTMIALSPGLAYRPDNLELEIRPNYRLQNTSNTLPGLKSSTVHNYGGMFFGTWYAPLGFVIATDLRYTATSGYSAGYDTRTWMWNASLSYQFLKNRMATVAVKAYDLLNQRNSIQRSVTAQYTDDTSYNTLSRYFMFSFTLKFNTFGKGNEPASREMGPGGHGPGGHGPGGPRRF